MTSAIGAWFGMRVTGALASKSRGLPILQNGVRGPAVCESGYTTDGADPSPDSLGESALTSEHLRRPRIADSTTSTKPKVQFRWTPPSIAVAKTI
jgi:hypothetical protein